MTNQAKKQVIFIVGPTAVGKTDLAIALAQSLKTVIISADSRQCYQEMSIGTAKPTEADLIRATHYFINSHSITEDFSAGDFEKEALALLDTLFLNHDRIVVVGGSGLFVDALEKGLDELPKPLSGIREKWNDLYKNHGIKFLQDQLSKVDPDYFDEVDQQNPQRLIRALEVFDSTGKPFSFYRQKNWQKRSFESLKFALNMDRERLYQRINLRVDRMNEAGLLEEVRALVAFRDRTALKTVGYREVFDFLDGTIETWDTALDKIKQNSRHYAKRQITWFKKDPETIWLDAQTPTHELVKSIIDCCDAGDHQLPI